jgi:quinoprotein glucose dehydrogenase
MAIARRIETNTISSKLSNRTLFSAVLLWLLLLSGSASAASRSTWSEYGGSADSSQYSDLAQVNRDNVQKLHVLWRYSTGDSGKYLFNPIVVNGVMYVLAKGNSIVALDAQTGKELWVHETDAKSTLIPAHGINYWQSNEGSDARLLFSVNNFLQAIDARKGKRILDFGKDGRVDLREGLGRDPETLHLVQSTFPGKIFGDLLILGSTTNEEYNSGPGDVRAYNARTGKLVWSFHTIPHPGEYGYDTWPPNAWKTAGGANAWSELTLDEQHGIVFVPTASPKYNFYGANRTGANLFGDSLLALDARTGRRLWHFQMVHHDIWDYDNATAPKLLTVNHDGKKMDLVVQVNKEGFVWVFERDTGKPLWPTEERPVPKSDMPGEETWPTQPFPSKPPPFARQAFTEKDLNPYITDPAERQQLLDRVRNARNEGLFTPPSIRGSIEMPGNNGGANFGGAAVDPRGGTLFVVSKDLPALLKLQLTKASNEGVTGPQYKTPFGFLFTDSGLPAITPPWTTLTAYDLNKGVIEWQVPLGEVPELAAEGIHATGSHFPKVGPVVTAGGLLFAGTRDRKLRALDTRNGKVLWETELNAGLEGMPAVYELDGHEYIAVCAAAQATTHTHPVAGHPASTDPIPGEYVVFGLE